MWQFFVNHPPLAGSRKRYTSLTLAAALFFPAIAYAQCPPEPGGPPSCTAPGPASPASNAGTDLAVGNPLNVITGNKYQREDDMPALPGVLGLELVRHYNSASSGPQFPGGLLGRGWRLSYETRLVVLGNTIQILQADGARLIFNRNPGNPSLCSTGDPVNGSITVGKGGAGGEEFSWTWTNGRTLSFDAAGKLLQIRAPSGEFVSLQYDQLGVLVKVIDPQGRSLTMSYPDRKAVGADGRYGGVRAIDSPVGRFRYEYGSMPPPKHTLADPRVLWASLVAVHYPAEAASVAAPGVAASRLYHYENPRFPTLLTGISLAGGGPIRRYATYGYDEAGLAVLSTHANGAGKVTLAFPKAGTTLLTNALGQQTVYRHALVAGMQRLLEVRGPGCATCGETNVRYDYDKLGRLTTTTQLDVAGKPLKASALVLDAVGRIVTVSDIAYAGGKPGQARLQVRYAYQGTGPEPLLIARPSVVEGREAQRLLSYNDAGQLTGVTEQGWAPAVHGPPQPITRRTAYTYALVNGRSVLTQIDGPLPNGAANSPADSDVTRFTYDASGNFPTRIVEPGNRVTDIAGRDTAGRATEVASSDGVRLLQTRAAYLRTGQAATLRYGGWLLGADKKALANSARSRVFRYEVDAHGRMLGRSAPGDITLRYQYDAAGNTTHTVAADGSQTVSRYDLENRLTALTQFGPGAVAASLQRFEYDSGRLSRSDVSVLGGPAGASLSSVSYATRQGALAPSIYGTPAASMPDAPAGTGLRHGQVASVAQGLVEQVTRADGSVIRRWVDDFGRVTAIDGGERGLQQARYTGDDQLSRLEDARGAVTLFERDSLGRLTQVHGEGAEPERVLFRFEGAVLAQQTRWKGNVLDSTIEWQHDVWGNPVGKRLIIAARTGQAHAISLAVANSVDEALRQSEKTLPSGALLRYRADRAGRVTSILLNGKPLVSAIGHAFHADAVVPVRFMYGNGLLSETTYDVNGHLATHASGIERRRFVTDAEGRITTIARQPVESGNPVRQAAAPGWFDSISAANAQAVAAPAGAAGVAAQRYAYDASGRLVSERGPGNSRPDLAYDKIGNRLGGPPALLDAAGNVLRLRGQQFIYSRFGELSEARAANGDVRASYRYDPDGIRYAKEVNGATSYFLYEDDQLIAEADAAGRIVSEYIYLGKRPVARLRHVPAEGVLASLKGASSVVEYLHTDQRGALEGITDGDRKIVWRARLSAFGEAAVVKGKAGAMPLRLAGQYADPETGLYYNVHRYYDPASGRYTQADPIGIAAGLNLFAYAESDPLGKSDSTGLNIDPDDPPTVSRPWLFGTFVHGMFANQVRAYGTGWGANDTRMNPKPTWPGVRPDAYYVDPMNLRLERDKLPFVGSLWELKPISWSSAINPSKYAAAKAEVAFYISSARPGGCWSAGASSAMAGLKADTLIYDKKLWMINYVPDATNTGLVFYTKTAAPQKPEPATVPAPSLSESEKAELERSLQELKLEGEREGWSKLAKIGMVVLIGIAIAALLFVALRAAAVLAAILATFKLVLAAARAGTATLMAGLSAMLGLNPTTVAAQAEVKGDEKEKGLLDGTIAWFKSWF